ncbi:hypothetical protein VTO73DRAFT_9878 [Trametes versicolor]
MPGLNNDVLLEVMAASSTKARARLMATSRALYSHGARHLLRETPYIHTEQQLLSFLAFLSAHPDRCSKFLREIELSDFVWSSPACVQLAEVLSRVSGLQCLTLNGKRCGTGPTSIQIPAWGAISSLQELRLCNAYETCLDLLRQHRSPLKRVVVDCPPNFDECFFYDLPDDDDWTAYHPVHVLQHLAPTLEELRTTGWCTHPEVEPDPDIVYPRLRTLAMRDASLPLTLSLIRAYPNLEHLSFNMRHAFPDEIEEYRLWNLNAQFLAGRTWRHLRAFEGDLVDLYVLGLACTIERVTLRLPPRHRDWPGVELLTPVLAEARPRHLELDGWPGDVRGPRGDGKFAVFTGECAALLETLTIEGPLWGMEHVDVDVRAVLEDLLASLAHSPLRHFALHIYTEHIDPTSGEKPGPPLGAAEQAARDLDVEATLGRFVAGIPTLRTAVLSVQVPRDRLRTQRAVLEDGSVSFEEEREELWNGPCPAAVFLDS